MTLDPTFSGVEMRDGKCYLIPSNPFRQDPQPWEPTRVYFDCMWLIVRYRTSVSPAAHPGGQWMARCDGFDRWYFGDSIGEAVCRSITGQLMP